jgi:hypothetical protein
MEKDVPESGDQDFERFIRENTTNGCIPFPLILLREKIKAIQPIYSETLKAYLQLPNDDPMKEKLLGYVDKYATSACETFDQFNFLMIEDEEDEGEGDIIDD